MIFFVDVSNYDEIKMLESIGFVPVIGTKLAYMLHINHRLAKT